MENEGEISSPLYHLMETLLGAEFVMTKHHGDKMITHRRPLLNLSQGGPWYLAKNRITSTVAN